MQGFRPYGLGHYALLDLSTEMFRCVLELHKDIHDQDWESIDKLLGLKFSSYKTGPHYISNNGLGWRDKRHCILGSVLNFCLFGECAESKDNGLGWEMRIKGITIFFWKRRGKND
jgi:hypothetical protein